MHRPTGPNRETSGGAFILSLRRPHYRSGLLLHTIAPRPRPRHRHRRARAPRHGSQCGRFSFTAPPKSASPLLSAWAAVSAKNVVGRVLIVSMTNTAIAASGLDRATEKWGDSPPESPLSASRLETLRKCPRAGNSFFAAACLDTMAELIDDVVEADREVARATAWRAAVIDQVRAWSEATASLMAPDLSVVRRWSADAVARRSLVSEIAAALRLVERTAENLIEESRSLLRELPATMAALSEGDISHRRAQMIMDHAN